MNKSTLSNIAKKINKADILWAIGGSVLLNQYNLIDNPRDIDILVAEKDAEKLHTLLKELGKYIILPPKKPFLTKYFYHYIIDDVEIDVIGAFRIEHDNGIYEYEFDSYSVTTYNNINGINIPFSSLEDWYVLYQLIPGRHKKVSIIENFLKNNGVKHSALLQRSLNKSLPHYVREKIKFLST